MSALVLDAGAFIAVDRDDRAMVARLAAARRAGLGLRSTGAVVAQVWRGTGGRQANLARLLKAVHVVAVDEHVGKVAGILLGRAGSTDAVDASVVTVAAAGDRIVTSDTADINRLVAAAGLPILVVGC